MPLQHVCTARPKWSAQHPSGQHAWLQLARFARSEEKARGVYESTCRRRPTAPAPSVRRRRRASRSLASVCQHHQQLLAHGTTFPGPSIHIIALPARNSFRICSPVAKGAHATPASCKWPPARSWRASQTCRPSLRARRTPQTPRLIKATGKMQGQPLETLETAGSVTLDTSRRLLRCST